MIQIEVKYKGIYFFLGGRENTHQLNTFSKKYTK